MHAFQQLLNRLMGCQVTLWFSKYKWFHICDVIIQIYSQLQQLCEIVYVKRLGYKDCTFGVVMHCSTWLQQKWSSKHNFWLFCSLKEQLWITMWFKLHYAWYAYYYFMKLSWFLILILFLEYFFIFLLLDSFKARFNVSGGINFIVHPQLYMHVGFKRKF